MVDSKSLTTTSVTQMLRAQKMQLARLQNHMGARQWRIVRMALRETEDRLMTMRLRGNDPFTRARLASTLIMLSRAVAEMVVRQRDMVTDDLLLVSRRSQKLVATWLSTLDRHYHGSVRPLNFDSLAWWDENHRDIGRTRIRHYTRSWLRYGSSITEKIENEIGKAVLVGEPWHTARKRVMQVTGYVAESEQHRVDRILRTESSAVYNGTQLRALLSEDRDDDPMEKKLVAHFDGVTGRDSVLLHGQTRPVKEPFFDVVNRISYQSPPNRPHDREMIVGWRKSYGDDFDDFDAQSATDYDQDIHGPTRRDLIGSESRDLPKMAVTRPRRLVEATGITSRERSEQIQSMRRERRAVEAQAQRTRRNVEALRRRVNDQVDASTRAIGEQLRTHTQLLSTLTQKRDDLSRWINLTVDGGLPRTTDSA